MHFVLRVVGNTKESFLKSGEEYFLKRLKHYHKVEIQVVPEPKNTKVLTPDQQKEKEAEGLLDGIQGNDILILLDEKGVEYTSRSFADQLQKWMNQGPKRIFFLVGGPYGFAPSVYNKANGMLGLSKMTFTHEMIRTFFLEQLYRSFTIHRNEPYHHD